MIYLTRGLLDVLLEMASESEPEAVTVVLAPTAAGEFDADLGVDPSTPILTHFYLPDAGRSVSAVFGVDLGTPAGRGRARFLSHPQGPPEPTEEDDFAAVIVVAVPPWRTEDVRAFDRSGTRLDVELVDAEPPDESLGD